MRATHDMRAAVDAAVATCRCCCRCRLRCCLGLCTRSPVQRHVVLHTLWPTCDCPPPPPSCPLCRLASIGAAVGWAMSVATGYLLR